MDQNQQNPHRSGKNRRVVGPYIHKQTKKTGSRRGLLIAMIVLAALSALTAAGAAYWHKVVRPPETAMPQESILTEPQTEPEVHEEDPEELRARIVGQAEEIDLSGLQQRDGVFTVLVAGMDVSGQLTDTLAVATFDSDARSVAIMNIPRDTLSKSGNGTAHKINSAYGRGGMDCLRSELSDLLGFEINRYVIVSFSAFTRIVDAIGGIDIEVPVDMYKNTGDMLIDLKAGYQHLDGEHALMLMRYRSYDNADIDRINMQQQVYQVVIRKLATPATILKLPSLTSILARNVETDMTVGEWIWIGTNYASMDTESVQMYTLPHTAAYINDISYVLPSEREILALVNDSFNPYFEEITKLRLAEIPPQREEPSETEETGSDPEPDAELDEMGTDQNETEHVPDWISGTDPAEPDAPEPDADEARDE